ncbi:MAG: response regulator [Crocinitomicaceae bacterium]|nr:response regulator [Crocinitomicaceae bacterium]
MDKEALEYSGKKPPKILMVDDKPANLVALRKVLAPIEAELFEAEDGNEALKLTLEHEFALALLDVQMPGMDGYELAEIMRTDPHTTDIPIIFISAIFTDKLNIFKGYEKGAFSFITKPFEPVELLNKVKFFVEKYHTRKAFEISQMRYKDLYNKSPDMLISVDVETAVIMECNETLLRTTGFNKDEIIGKTIFDLYHKDHVDKAKQALEEFKKKGRLKNIELAISNKDGEKLEVLLNAEGITDLKGQVIKSNSSLRDISELKKTRKKLEKALHDLERHTEELENFVYVTSHDLQEPMLTVLSFIQLLEDEYGESLDKDAKDYIHYCVQAAARMRELITCLLDYLRIGHDDTTEDIHLKDVINEVLDELQGSIKEAKAKIKLEGLPQLTANSDDIKRLFHNLISNAIKFKKPNVDPIIEVKAQDDGDWWEFSVKDNGIGIEEKQFKKVFQMFKQLHKRGEYKGMGVGMAICKKIVEYYGGTIWVESQEGEGTVFYFKLPKQLHDN